MVVKYSLDRMAFKIYLFISGFMLHTFWELTIFSRAKTSKTNKVMAPDLYAT